MTGTVGLWWRLAQTAAFLGLIVLDTGCLEAPPPDLTYPRADVSEEVFRVFCRRVAKDAYPDEADGQRFYAICDGKDEEGGELDVEAQKPQLRGLLRRRPEIIDSLDRVFGETDVAGGDKFKEGELSGFLQALVPLYDQPLETIPTATRGIAQLLTQLVDREDPRAQKVLDTVERLVKRTGYRAPDKNLGALRALFTYPELDKLAQTLLPVITANGAAHQQWVNVLNAAALELADEPKKAADLDDTTLHTALSLLLKVDDAQATGNVGAATVLLREKNSGDALKVAGAAVGASPFAIAGRDDDGAARDATGIALSGGKPAYETIDASKTLLAALMRETSVLIARGDAERSPLENFAHGLKPLLGPWSTRTQLIGDNDYEFVGPDIESSALLEVTHAFASMMRYPEAAPLVRTLDKLIHEHENDATAFDYAALAIDAMSDEYEDAKLNGPHEFWDDLLSVGVRMSKRPGMIEALIRSFTDPKAGAQGKLFATWMRYNDAISYPNSPSDSPDDFNKLAEGGYTQLVNRDKPDVGLNRSIWQRTMSLINSLNGVEVCNKDAAILKVNTGIGELVFPFGDLAGAGYKRCDLIQIQDAVEIYAQAVNGKAKITIKDAFADLLSVLGKALTISGTVGEIMEAESKIKGFNEKPSPQSLARFIFAPRAKFISDLFTPQETVDKLPVALYEPNGLFPMEMADASTSFDGKPSSFVELGVPLIDGFDAKESRNPVDGKLTDGYMFGHSLSVLHRHWSSRKDGPCPAEVEVGNEGCTQHLDPKAPLYSPQTGLVSYEPLLARALDDEHLVEILHQATVALAAIKVPGADGAEIDGITALGNFAQRLLTPDPTLFKHDGKTNTTQSNLCVRQGDACKDEVGHVITPLAPMHLVADALKAMDDTFKGENAERLQYWHEGRSGILDAVLTVDRTGSESDYKYSLRDRTAWNISNAVLPWLAEQIEAHQKANDQAKWADGLSGRAATILKHPLTAATVDLLDAFWPEAEASGEFTRITSYLTDERNEDAFLGMLTAAADSLILLDRDADLSPAIQFAALGLAPNAFKAIEGEQPNGDKSVAYAGLELTGGVVKELNKKKAPGTQTALSKLLKNLVLGDEAQRSPLEVLLDATADVNRPDETASPETPLTAEEDRDVFKDVSSFLYDKDQEKRSLERLYTVIQGRKVKK